MSCLRPPQPPLPDRYAHSEAHAGAVLPCATRSLPPVEKSGAGYIATESRCYWHRPSLPTGIYPAPHTGKAIKPGFLRYCSRTGKPHKAAFETALEQSKGNR